MRLAQVHLLQEEWSDAAAVLRKALAKGGLADPGSVAAACSASPTTTSQKLQEARSWFARAQQSGATRQQADDLARARRSGDRSTAGVFIFGVLKKIGQIDLVIALAYVLLLGIIGITMLQEAVRAIVRSRSPKPSARKLHQHTWVHGLPFKMRFRKSRLYISALLPIAVGFIVGLLAALMGVGGAFLMVPAMIYLLGMPTTVVVGTSLFQIIFVAANVTLLQAVQNQTVDAVLATVLVLGGVIGAQIGGRLGGKLKGDQLRILLALLVFGVAAGLAYELVSTPDELYSIAPLGVPL